MSYLGDLAYFISSRTVLPLAGVVGAPLANAAFCHGTHVTPHWLASSAIGLVVGTVLQVKELPQDTLDCTLALAPYNKGFGEKLNLWAELAMEVASLSLAAAILSGAISGVVTKAHERAFQPRHSAQVQAVTSDQQDNYSSTWTQFLAAQKAAAQKVEGRAA